MECPRIAQKRAEISRSRPPGGGAAHFFMGTGTASGDALPKTRPQSRRLVYTGQGREAKTVERAGIAGKRPMSLCHDLSDRWRRLAHCR